MFRLIILINLVVSTLVASVLDINTKISSNKKLYKSVSKDKKTLDKDIESLIKKINEEENNYKKIVTVLEVTNNKLFLNKLKLSNANQRLIKLKKESIALKAKKEEIEKKVVDYTIEKYAMSMGIKLANKESLSNIIDKEVYTLIFQNAKDEVFELNIDYLKINKATRENQDKMKKTDKFIVDQEAIKQRYKQKEKEQEKVLNSLKSKHKAYQKHLKTIIKKQNKVTDLLGSLNILKKKEIAREKKRIKAAKELLRKKELAKKRKQALLDKKNKQVKKIKYKDKIKFDDDVDIEVRKIGSSAKGIKISKYRGKKTIAPLKSYTITKKFGKYYDKVYKMKLFNESVTLKAKKKNSKVFSVFKGKVVYAKRNSGLLENVVIVKHSGSLHTIYSHLDKISPTLKVGKWIPKGYVVGRVNDKLLFQATKDSKYIDPTRLFK
ncbi:MAG: M23 family metallopeptidase [Campylobacterota bacterium]|nr:M23 family metallopeptidase [Campylobacterota bacterium]